MTVEILSPPGDPDPVVRITAGTRDPSRHQGYRLSAWRRVVAEMELAALSPASIARANEARARREARRAAKPEGQ
jgi:hypothetical protein